MTVSGREERGRRFRVSGLLSCTALVMTEQNPDYYMNSNTHS